MSRFRPRRTKGARLLLALEHAYEGHPAAKKPVVPAAIELGEYIFALEDSLAELAPLVPLRSKEDPRAKRPSSVARRELVERARSLLSGTSAAPEPDDSEVIIVSLDDVNRVTSEVLGGDQPMPWSKLRREIADRLRAGASDE